MSHHSKKHCGCKSEKSKHYYKKRCCKSEKSKKSHKKQHRYKRKFRYRCRKNKCGQNKCSLTIVNRGKKLYYPYCYGQTYDNCSSSSDSSSYCSYYKYEYYC